MITFRSSDFSYIYLRDYCLHEFFFHSFKTDILSFRSEGTTLLKYKIPTRGLLGLRNAILTATRGTAILNTIFDSYGPWAGDISTRDQGSLVILSLDQSYLSLVDVHRFQA